jgi:hypothetical protein
MSTKLELPTLSSSTPMTAVNIMTWLTRCDDAFEAFTLLNPEKDLKAGARILLVGLKMEHPDAAQWWTENRDTLKALTKYEDFVGRVRERFVPVGWKLDALATFYAIRQNNRPFEAFVAALQSARGLLGTAGSPFTITDSVFKNHLLLFSNPTLCLRVRAIPDLGFETKKVDTLISIMSAQWNALINEGLVKPVPGTSAGSLPSHSTSSSSSSVSALTDTEKQALKAAGGCFHCRKTPAHADWTPHSSRDCPGDSKKGIPPRRITAAAITAAAITWGCDSSDDEEERVTSAAVLPSLPSSQLYWCSSGEDDDEDDEDDERF